MQEIAGPAALRAPFPRNPILQLSFDLRRAESFEGSRVYFRKIPHPIRT